MTGIRTAPPYSMSNTSLITNLDVNRNTRPFPLGFFREKTLIGTQSPTVTSALTNQVFFLPFGRGSLPTIDVYGTAMSASSPNPSIVDTNSRGRVLNTSGNSFLFTTNNFTLSASYTKMAWIYPLSANQSQTGNIISTHSGGVIHYMWFENTTQLSAGHGGNFAIRVTDPQPIASNVWYHYAITYNNATQTMIIYRNGSNVNTLTNAAFAWSGSTGQLGIGEFGGANIFNGYLDDVRVFNTALTAVNISTIFTSVNSPSLLNRITSSAPLAAYSMRLVNTSYSNPVVQLRRAADNVIQDFYVNSDGFLNTGFAATGTPYSTWIGGSTAFVVTWYDQTGRGKNITQPTQDLQPPLVKDGGSGFCVYTASNRFLSGPNVFDGTSTNNMHLIMTSKEISRSLNVLVSLHGSNTGVPRFFIHGPYTNGYWYWDPLNFEDNRAGSSNTTTAVGQRVTFSGYKDPVSNVNGFRLNGGQTFVSPSNTLAYVSDGFVLNVTTGEYSNNHYIYNAFVFNSRLSVTDETFMEANSFVELYSSGQAYPPAAMTANTTVFTGLAYGNGTYIATSSATNTSAFNVFDRNAGTQFASTSAFNNNIWSGSSHTRTGAGTFAGPWVQIELPYELRIVSFAVTPQASTNAPQTMRLIASNDNTNWTIIHSTANNIVYTGSANAMNATTINVTTQVEYKYYLLTWLGIAGTFGGYIARLAEFRVNT
jgi:hypothetical protein